MQLQTQPTFRPSQLLFEESLLDHWMVHVNSHKLRRVTFKHTPPINVIQNLFCSFFSDEASNPILGESYKSYLLQQELFGAFSPPAVALIPPAPAAPPSPSFGSFLAIAKNMSFTFSAVLALVSMKRRLFSSA